VPGKTKIVKETGRVKLEDSKRNWKAGGLEKMRFQRKFWSAQNIRDEEKKLAGPITASHSRREVPLKIIRKEQP